MSGGRPAGSFSGTGPLPPTLDGQLARLSAAVPAIGSLLEQDLDSQRARGYFHTLREIAQQPLTWMATARGLARQTPLLEAALAQSGIADKRGALVLTGSGSSLYVGESSTHTLQRALGVPVLACGGGGLLTHLESVLPPQTPLLVASIARSGNSPESCGVVDLLLERRQDSRHLVMTCCADGRLATSYRHEPRVSTIVLDQATCDRSLVMTSSFSNLALAARALAFIGRPSEYESLASRLAWIAQHMLETHTGRLADLAGRDHRSAVFLGSGDRFGAAREAALKMLEMTAGKVATFAETFLGLRHGPMSAINDHTLLVCFLSTDPLVRAYECDLIGELNAKRIGATKLMVGEHLPVELAAGCDVLLECPGLDTVGDDHSPLIDIVAGQLLAFFRCLRLGLRPDEPSASHVITRVVPAFAIHRS